MTTGAGTRRRTIGLAVSRRVDPVDDFKAAIEVLDDGSATFDPIPAIDVGERANLPDHGLWMWPQITPSTWCRAASAVSVRS